MNDKRDEGTPKTLGELMPLHHESNGPTRLDALLKEHDALLRENDLLRGHRHKGMSCAEAHEDDYIEIEKLKAEKREVWNSAIEKAAAAMEKHWRPMVEADRCADIIRSLKEGQGR